MNQDKNTAYVTSEKRMRIDKGIAVETDEALLQAKTEIIAWMGTLTGIVFALGGSFLLIEIQKSTVTKGTWLLWLGLAGSSLAVLSIFFGIAAYLSHIGALSYSPHYRFWFKRRSDLGPLDWRDGPTGNMVREQKAGVSEETWEDAKGTYKRWVKGREVLLIMQVVAFSLAITCIFVDVIAFVLKI